MGREDASRSRWRATSASLLALAIVQADSRPPFLAIEGFAERRVVPIARALARDPAGTLQRTRSNVEASARRLLAETARAIERIR